MARPKQTKAALAKLNMQFIQYGISKPINYEQYLRIVDHQPITRRELKQLFLGRWERMLRSLIRYYPNVYTDAAIGQTTPFTTKEIEKGPETILDIRDRWRNSTAAPSKDPYSGVNIATIVNKHGKELANGTDLEKQYVRGALIEIWIHNKARGMDSSKVPVTEDLRWKDANFGDLTKEEEAHLATGLTASESKPESGLGFGHEQSTSDKKGKLSGLEALKQLGAKKEEDNGKDI
jgi:hypothetical protein